MPSTPSVRGIVVRLAAAASLAVPLMGSNLSAVPSWGNACGDGRVDGVLEDFDSSSGFAVFKAHASIPDPALSTVPGCRGQALAFGYDLRNASPVDGQSWIVLQRSFAVTDLRSFTHLRLAVRGSNLNSHDDLEVKLWDGNQLYAVTLKSMTDVPAWRPIYIDFRELHNAGAMNLATISRLEIAVVRCNGPDCEVPDTPGAPMPPAEHTGTLFVDEFAFVNLRPGAGHRLIETGFERVNPNPAVAAAAAAAIAAGVARTGQGLIPAWFSEPSPNYNTYTMAEALLVLVYEYERTGNTAYHDLARSLADRLLSLQIPAGRINAGAWYTAHDRNLLPPYRPLPNLAPGPQPPCDGNETMIPDGGQLVATNIDACEWVGNVGWVLIALGKLQRSGWYDDAARLRSARTRGAQWLLSQVGRHAGYPALISLGIEGNISAYFGLLASDRRSEGTQLGNAVFQFGWDSTERRMTPGASDVATAMDVSGSWGVTLLRSIGRVQEALDSQGYTATVLRTTSFDETIAGYGDIAGPFTPALEFLAQGAVAGIKDADFVVQQSRRLQIPPGGSFPGAFPGAPDHWFGGALSPWSTTMPGVSPTAWMYFAVAGIDPLWETFEPGGTGLPGAPTGVTAQVSGTSVTLRWSAPASGGAPTSYVIEAGTSPGASNLGAFNVGAATSITARAGQGTYYVRVRAVNAQGPGAASAEVSFTVGGGSGVPGAPGGLSATVNGRTVTLTWSPASGSVSAYLLEAGTNPGAMNIGSFTIGPATSYVAVQVPPGTYYVRVRAAGPGGVSGPSNEVAIVVH